MTKMYHGLGLACMYPENWRVTEDTDGGRLLGFTLESPTHSFMTVTEYPITVPPSQAIEEAHETMRLEYDDVEFEEIETDFGVTKASITDCKAGDVRFYYLDLLVVSRLISFCLDNRTFLIQIQAEDRDFESLELVFQAILVSMLQSVQDE